MKKNKLKQNSFIVKGYLSKASEILWAIIFRIDFKSLLPFCIRPASATLLPVLPVSSANFLHSMILWWTHLPSFSFVYTVNLNKCHCPLDESINQLIYNKKLDRVWQTAHEKKKAVFNLFITTTNHKKWITNISMNWSDMGHNR